MKLHDIEAFFTAYADAFNELSGDAVAAHWATPCAISQAGQVTWWAERAPILENHRKLCEVYRAAGFAHCEPRLLEVVLMGGFDAFARVDWTLTRADGSVLQRFATGYQLKRVGGRIQVLMCTAYDEDLGSLKEAAAR